MHFYKPLTQRNLDQDTADDICANINYELDYFFILYTGNLFLRQWMYREQDDVWI